jgi:hypothetical protein
LYVGKIGWNLIAHKFSRCLLMTMSHNKFSSYARYFYGPPWIILAFYHNCLEALYPLFIRRLGIWRKRGKLTSNPGS